MRLHGAPIVGMAVFVAAGAAADTLVLRNGRRIGGELVEYRYDRIQWRDERGRTERFDRSDIRRIEFDDFASGTTGSWSKEDSRPGGMRQREVTVMAHAGWTRSGIQVERGQRITFEARGEVRWGPDRKDGPEGEHNSPHNPNRPIPSGPAAGLIGRVGNGDPFFIGNDRGEIRIRESGELELGINDDYLNDNSGAFRVIVYY
jgi:hypothetical protein